MTSWPAAGAGCASPRAFPTRGGSSEYYDHSSKYDLSAEAPTSPRSMPSGLRMRRGSSRNMLPTETGRSSISAPRPAASCVALRDRRFHERSRRRAVAGRRSRGQRDARPRRRRRRRATAARAWGTRFAVVSLVAVLEHLVDPGAALRDGQPSCSPRTASLYHPRTGRGAVQDHVDAPYQQFSVEHINYFTPASLGTSSRRWGSRSWSSERSSCKLSDDAARAGARGAVPPRPIAPSQPRCHRTADAVLRRYIARSAEKEAAILARIAELADDPEPDLRLGHGHARAAPAGHIEAGANATSSPSSTRTRTMRAGSWPAGPVMAPRTMSSTWMRPSWSRRPSARRPSRDRRGDLFGPDVPLILMY